jgi:hypothetical protein
MPLIEAALAFAITMLALSLIVSSFVEIIHRGSKMREKGLKYMLEQLFDQVLVKYAKPLAEEKVAPELKKARDDADTALKNAMSKAPLDESARKLLEADFAAAETALKSAMEGAYKSVRDGFVERMRANRVPIGLKADPSLAVIPKADQTTSWRLNPGRMWGGMHVTALTATDFMERLGNHELGDAIKKTEDKALASAVARKADTVEAVVKEVVGIDLAQAMAKATATGKPAADAAAEILKDITERVSKIDLRKEINDAAAAAGKGAADTLDTVLTDIAQKFDGFGKDASTYFEGRARFMSVIVAIVLAFAVHVDAFDLFRTYFRDPNARAKVIEQAQTITAQYDAAQKNIESLGQLEKAKNQEAAEKREEAKKLEEAQKQDSAQTREEAEKAEAAKKTEDAKNAEEAKNAAGQAIKSAADTKAQVEKLRKDALDAIDKTNETVKSFAGLGAPLGWTKERWDNAGMFELVWTCNKVKDAISPTWYTLGRECEIVETPDASGAVSPAQAEKSQPQAAQGQKKPAGKPKLERGVHYGVWFGFPSDLSVILYLLLGGLLIGLGSPFWYDAVTGLTNIRSMVSGAGSSAPAKPAPAPPQAADADKAQPVTPAGAFKVSSDAK